MSICLKIDSDIKMLSLLMQILDSCSSIDWLHFIVLQKIFGRRVIGIICLNKSNRRIAWCIHSDVGVFIEYCGSFFKFLTKPLIKSGKNSSLPITINQPNLLLNFDTKYKNSYNSTILSASPSNDTKQLYSLGSY